MRFSASMSDITVLTSIASMPSEDGRSSLGIDRHQIVLAGDLHAVAGIVEQRDAGAGQRRAEFGDLAAHRCAG